MKLDTISLVEAPEGIDLQAEVAGVVPRALAFTIDFFIRWVIFIIVLTISSVTGKAGIGLLLITFFILEWWYPVLFEVFRNGQTPGKKAFGIKVVKDDLTPISFGPSLTRNLLRTADFLPTFYVFGIISAVCTTKFQRLGDLAAGTLVIYSESLASPKENTLDKVEPIVPNRMLPESVQLAFINFSINRGNISADRQNELAEIVRDKLPPTTIDSADYIRGVGKWLLGSSSIKTNMTPEGQSDETV